MADAADTSNCWSNFSFNFRGTGNVQLNLENLKEQEEVQVTYNPEDLDPKLKRVLIIGKAGIGKTSAMKGELVTGNVKNAKGARAGAEAGTTKVEAPEKVKIWGTDTEFYCVDTPGMFQTSMIKNFMKGGSTESDFVLLCHDAANRATLENALQEIFSEQTITEFNKDNRFGILYLRMNLAEVCAEMSGDEFSEELVRKSSVAQMKSMLKNYRERTNIFFSYGSEAAAKKKGKEHWAKQFAKWLEGENFKTTLKVDTTEINKDPKKFMTKVVNQCEPEFQERAARIVEKTFFQTLGEHCTIL